MFSNPPFTTFLTGIEFFYAHQQLFKVKYIVKESNHTGEVKQLHGLTEKMILKLCMQGQ